MSLDYIFVASTIPVDEVQSIESFEPDPSKNENFYRGLVEKIFPDLEFSDDLGVIVNKNISCEINVYDVSLSVSMRGADDFIYLIEKAQLIAKKFDVVTIDVQTSKLFR